jgi:hypothetical protein
MATDKARVGLRRLGENRPVFTRRFGRVLGFRVRPGRGTRKGDSHQIWASWVIGVAGTLGESAGTSCAADPSVRDRWNSTYDGLHRLRTFDRGNLAGTAPDYTGVTSTSYKQDFTLDQLGNWTTFKDDADGNGWDFTQTRTHDAANEITQIDSSTVHVAEDAAGNMTKIPQPGNWSADIAHDAEQPHARDSLGHQRLKVADVRLGAATVTKGENEMSVHVAVDGQSVRLLLAARSATLIFE